MKSHPMLFTGPMIRAILEGRKTMTRRVMKPQPDSHSFQGWWYPEKGHKKALHYANKTHLRHSLARDFAPIQPGDTIWCRETHFYCLGSDSTIYKADTDKRGESLQDNVGTMNPEKLRWKPSIHMPRWACRLKLEVVSVRVERVQDITDEDAIAEGVVKHYFAQDGVLANDEGMYRPVFKSLWNSINAARGFGWDNNPYVWVYEFKVKEGH